MDRWVHRKPSRRCLWDVSFFWEIEGPEIVEYGTGCREGPFRRAGVLALSAWALRLLGRALLRGLDPGPDRLRGRQAPGARSGPRPPCVGLGGGGRRPRGWAEPGLYSGRSMRVSQGMQPARWVSPQRSAACEPGFSSSRADATAGLALGEQAGSLWARRQTGHAQSECFLKGHPLLEGSVRAVLNL